MLSKTLKERTLTAHQELEKKLVAKMRDLGSLANLSADALDSGRDVFYFRHLLQSAR